MDQFSPCELLGHAATIYGHSGLTIESASLFVQATRLESPKRFCDALLQWLAERRHFPTPIELTELAASLTR